VNRFDYEDASTVQASTVQASTGKRTSSTLAGEPLGMCEPLPPSILKAGAYGVTEVDPEKPCATVTIGSPGNDLAVPAGITKRKFTIAELRRICAFPDDFILTGSYAQQWERLGRSVPPVMMAAVASAIRDGILKK
jgi:DNA (cytosine-5)-methyltransferase 1